MLNNEKLNEMNTPALYYYIRDKNHEELNPYIKTKEEFLSYMIKMNSYEPTWYKLNNLDNNYIDYRDGLLIEARVKRLAQKFSAHSKESFIWNFSKILIEHPSAKLIGDDYVAIWEEYKNLE